MPPVMIDLITYLFWVVLRGLTMISVPDECCSIAVCYSSSTGIYHVNLGRLIFHRSYFINLSLS